MEKAANFEGWKRKPDGSWTYHGKDMPPMTWPDTHMPNIVVDENGEIVEAGGETPLGPISLSEPHDGIPAVQRILFEDTLELDCVLEQDFEAPHERIFFGLDQDWCARLDQKMVRSLIAVLEQWLLTGNFTDSTEVNPRQPSSQSGR